MGSHYIPVGKIKIDKEILDIACPAAGYGETPPDPAIYCTANGYNVPDPGYVPDEALPTIETPLTTEQILLLCSNQYAAYVNFYVAGGASGFTWEVYGDGDTLLDNGASANGTFGYTFTGTGYQGADLEFYKLVFRPVGAENLTMFRVYSYSVVYPIIEAYINAPYLTLLNFDNSQLLKKVWMCDTMNSLNQTSTYKMFQKTYNLEEITMPSSMTSQTRIDYWFAYSGVKKVILPADMSALTVISAAFQYSEATDITFPTTCPNLSNIVNMCAYMPFIEEITIPATWPTGISALYAFRDCKQLKTITIPETIAFTNVSYMFNNCYKLAPGQTIIAKIDSTVSSLNYAFAYCRAAKKIVFDGSADNISSIAYMARDSDLAEELVLPTSMNGMTVWNNTTIGDLKNLKKITLPLSMNSLTSFQLFLTNTKEVEEITTCNDWGTNVITFSLGVTLFKLKRFDQPTLKTDSLSLNGNSGQNTLLEYVEVDWDYCVFIYLAWNNLDATEIDRIFTALPIVSGVEEITVTGNPGAAGCNPAIATAKGWTVNV